MVYFPRDLDRELLEWGESEHRKPLILRGARQTGKTASVRHFGASFDLFVELNLERFDDLSMVRACRTHTDLLSALKARHNIAKWPRRTLLFLDEIQESPKAVNWLRFLYEDHPDLFVIAAGSLMEVRMADRGFSFPVGRVTFRNLRPFSFAEFLQAIGKKVLRDTLSESTLSGGAPPPPVHDQALELLRDYLIVGGMPEAVALWASEGSFEAVRRLHTDLVNALAEDIQKYGRDSEVHYLEAAFENLRHHYGTRFKYENFAPGFRSQLMKTAIQKLEQAMVATRVWPTSSFDMPLQEKSQISPETAAAGCGHRHIHLRSEHRSGQSSPSGLPARRPGRRDLRRPGAPWIQGYRERPALLGTAIPPAATPRSTTSSKVMAVWFPSRPRPEHRDR